MTQPDSRPGLPIVLVADTLAVDDKGRVPMVRNMGNWWLPGGRVHPGESFTAAAIRETAEETGLRLKPAGIVRITQQVRQDRHIIFATVRGRVTGQLAAPIDDPKIDAVRWASIAEAEELMADLDGELGRLFTITPIAEAVE